MPRPDPVVRIHQERRAQLRGLLYLALAAMLFLILRFGAGLVFQRGWWRF